MMIKSGLIVNYSEKMKFKDSVIIEQDNRDTNKVKLLLNGEEGESYCFIVRVELINHIVIETNKRLTVTVQTEDEAIQVLCCDFAELYPAYNHRVIKKVKRDSHACNEDALEYAGELRYAITKRNPQDGTMMYLGGNGWLKKKREFSTTYYFYEGSKPVVPSVEMKSCINKDCNKKIKATVNFCSGCGSNQTVNTEKKPEVTNEQIETIIRKCKNPECLRDSKPNAKFCHYCGSKLT